MSLSQINNHLKKSATVSPNDSEENNNKIRRDCTIIMLGKWVVDVKTLNYGRYSHHMRPPLPTTVPFQNLALRSLSSECHPWKLPHALF